MTSYFSFLAGLMQIIFYPPQWFVGPRHALTLYLIIGAWISKERLNRFGSAKLNVHVTVSVYNNGMCVLYVRHVLGVNWDRFREALRTLREKNHTHSDKQSNQFVYQTQHLMVICECV